jgi:hypothetical protein
VRQRDEQNLRPDANRETSCGDENDEQNRKETDGPHARVALPETEQRESGAQPSGRPACWSTAPKGKATGEGIEPTRRPAHDENHRPMAHMNQEVRIGNSGRRQTKMQASNEKTTSKTDKNE